MAGEAEFQKYSRGCVYRLIHFYGDDAVNESDLYKELGTLTKDRERCGSGYCFFLQQSGLASEGTCGECAWQDRARRLSPD